MIGAPLASNARPALDVIVTPSRRRRWKILVCGSCNAVLANQDRGLQRAGTCSTCGADLFRNPDCLREVLAEHVPETQIHLEAMRGGRIADRIPPDATLTERMQAELARRMPDARDLRVEWTPDGELRWRGTHKGQAFDERVTRTDLRLARDMHQYLAQQASATVAIVERRHRGIG